MGYNFYNYEGLKLWEGDKLREYDIAEAPFKMIRSPRACSLDEPCILSDGQSTKLHIRLHDLGATNDFKESIDLYEDIPSTAAVIFINTTNKLTLNNVPDHITYIPLYVISYDDGSSIHKIIDTNTKCQIVPDRAEYMVNQDSYLEIDLALNRKVMLERQPSSSGN